MKMDMHSEIETKLQQVFQDVFDDESIEIRPEMTARDVDGWDSMNHLRLILAVERTFKMRLASTKISGLKTVGELIDLIAASA
ncbi:MAG TPA: acyl carrier protein [Aliidongia sp.]|nr:acyl carrier protein [Aliidongia sp.]